MGVKEGVLDRKGNIYFFLQLQEECPQHTPASLGSTAEYAWEEGEEGIRLATGNLPRATEKTQCNVFQNDLLVPLLR